MGGKRGKGGRGWVVRGEGGTRGGDRRKPAV